VVLNGDCVSSSGNKCFCINCNQYDVKSNDYSWNGSVKLERSYRTYIGNGFWRKYNSPASNYSPVRMDILWNARECRAYKRRYYPRLFLLENRHNVNEF